MNELERQACGHVLRMGVERVREVLRGQTVRVVTSPPLTPPDPNDYAIFAPSFEHHEIAVNHRLLREYIGEELLNRPHGNLDRHERDAIRVYEHTYGRRPVVRPRAPEPEMRQAFQSWVNESQAQSYTAEDEVRRQQQVARQQEQEMRNRQLREQIEQMQVAPPPPPPPVIDDPWAGYINQNTDRVTINNHPRPGFVDGPAAWTGSPFDMGRVEGMQFVANNTPATTFSIWGGITAGQGLTVSNGIISAVAAEREYLPPTNLEATIMTTVTPFDWSQGNDAAVVRRLTCSDYGDGTFVRPKLTEHGQPAPRQNWKRGMLLTIHREQSTWGSVDVKDDYIGVMLSKDGDSITVFPIAGPMGSPARFKIDGKSHPLIRRDSGDIRLRGCGPTMSDKSWGAVQTLSARSATLVDPQTMGSVWWGTANFFRESYLDAFKPHRVHHTKVFKELDVTARGKFEKWHYDAHSLRSVSRLEERQKRKAAGIANAKGMGFLAILEKGNGVFSTEAYRVFTGVVLNSWVREKWNEKHQYSTATGEDNPFTLESMHCAHMAFTKDAEQIHNGYRLCSACVATAGTVIDALNGAGDSVRVWRGHTDLYPWADGTQRIVPEPPLVGSYHHAKSLVKKLPTVTGGEYSGVTVGIEIEMENSNHELRFDAHARELKNRLDAAMPPAWAAMKKKPRYAFFERDGSVNFGFEMVTAYGDPEVHRHFISRAFGPDTPDGKLPFARKLHAFDAESSCGIHVHLTKPETVTHAVKLQAFFNDPEHRRLVRAVARRYSGNYSKYDENRTAAGSRAITKTAIANVKRSYGKDVDMKTAVKYAAEMVGNGDRYQVVNMTGKNTVEIRAFKSSMLPTTILACMEFSVMAWLYTRDVKAVDMKIDHFLDYISRVENRSQSRYLRSYLAVRGFKCFVPKLPPNTVAPVTEFNCEEC